MITLNASGGSVTFTFSGNSTYLNDGTIEVPVNSLALIIDESDMATFRKAASNDIFVSANIAEFGMTKDELIAWYKENMVGSTGGGGGVTEEELNEAIAAVKTEIEGEIPTVPTDISAFNNDAGYVTSGYVDSSVSGYADSCLYDNNAKAVKFYHGGTGGTEVYSFDASPFLVDGMIDDVRIETISGVTYLVIDFNTASGKEDIQIPLTDIFNPANYYDKTEIDAIVSGKADTTAVTEEISAAVSGKADSSAVTAAIDAAVSGKANSSDVYLKTETSGATELATAFAGKQDQLIAGENITISGNVISSEGGGCEVEETVVYNTFDSYLFDYQGDYKYEYAIVDYKGDKTSDTKGLYFIIGDVSNDYAQGYINLDYPNHSASTENTALTEYTTIEYISDIEDFKISVASAYQSTCWIKSIQNLFQTELKVEYYKINSGSPCTVIETDVVGLIEKVKGTVDNSLKMVSVRGYENKLEIVNLFNKGNSSSSAIKLEDLDGSNDTLKTNIQVGLGVSGWTEMTFNGSCNTNGNPKSPIIRLSGDTNSLDVFNTQWEINLEHYGYTYDSVNWNGSEFVLNSTWFGESGELGTATVTYDDGNNTLTIAYPLTAQVGDYTDNVELSNIYNQSCKFGTEITKLEYYAEQTQPLKPYVQETRAALGGLSLVKLTQSEYNALATKDDNTLYVVIPNP